MRKDKKEAIRIARLKQKAKTRGAAPMPGQKWDAAKDRGAAPPPPGGGGAKPAGKGPTAPAGGGEIKVQKYRATKAFKSDEIEYPEGATLFVMGAPDEKGNVMAVYDGKSGDCPVDSLVELTDEVLAKERADAEAEAEQDRLQMEAAINGDVAELERIEREKLEALDEKYRLKALEGASGDTEAEKMQAAASAAAAAKANEEIAEAKAAEEAIKAQAAELERLMRELDMSDDEDED
jgi:hypothetical protein